LHTSKHSIHLTGIHLTWIHARGHHLLHHCLHLRGHAIHSRHTSRRVAAATTTWHGHAAHHHHVELVHHLLIVLGKNIGAEFTSDCFLLGGVECPRKLVEAVVEVVADVRTRLAPRLVVFWEIFIASC
jgi:hypothetical protein